MEFVTGKAGTNHISGADMAAMYRGLLIADDVVLSEGDKLACTMLDANTAQIGTGSCMLQAHHCRVETAEQVAIESGSPGFKRNDLIVARYSKGDGNIQAIYLAVIKGTAVAGEPIDPTYTTGSIDGGDVLVEFPLWRIPIDGVSVGTPERVMPTVDTLQDQISDNAGDIADNATAIAQLRESVYQSLKEYSSQYASSSRKTLVKRFGAVVSIKFSGYEGLTANQSTDLFTLDVEYRPASSVDIDAYSPPDGFGRVNISKNGTVSVYPYGGLTSLSNMRGTYTYIK